LVRGESGGDDAGGGGGCVVVVDDVVVGQGRRAYGDRTALAYFYNHARRRFRTDLMMTR
jgi:hypothetical protein